MFSPVFFGPDDQQRSHLCDVGNWIHKEAIVTRLWAGGPRRFAVNSDDSGVVREAPGVWKHGNIVPHADNRKRIDSDRGPDGKERIHRKTEGIKLQGLNQYPIIVGIVKHQPFKYLELSTPHSRSTGASKSPTSD